MAESGLLTLSAATPTADADRRFLAYAAHELRSEIALQLVLTESTLADPNADTVALRDMGKRVAAACWRQEQLLEGLLTLVRSQHRNLRRESVDLAATAAEVLQDHDPQGLGTATTLEPARTIGDPQLIRRLIANLVSNAIRHNTKDGRLELATHTTTQAATFTIINTGHVVPARDLPRLFKPFEQLDHGTGSSTDGVGLGLAIVQAIADAHNATVAAQARTDGGLRIDVNFAADASATRLLAWAPMGCSRT